MLKAYLVSVVVWMIILYSQMFICRDELKKKIKTEDVVKTSLIKKVVVLFAYSAIPVFRFIIFVCIFYLAGCSQEDYDRLMTKNNP